MSNIIDPSEKKKEPVVAARLIISFTDQGHCNLHGESIHPKDFAACLSKVLSNLLNPEPAPRPAVQLPPAGLNGNNLRKRLY